MPGTTLCTPAVSRTRILEGGIGLWLAIGQGSGPFFYSFNLVG
jgi:hypothetical protein